MTELATNLAYVLLVVGTWAVVCGRRGGWLVRASGSAMWVWISLQVGLVSASVWCSIFVLTDTAGWIAGGDWWKKTDSC